MKRRVRIYKAQLGGVQALQEQQAQVQEQSNDQALLASIVAKLDEEEMSVMPEDILRDLMNAGVEQEKAARLVRAAMDLKEERDALSQAENEGDQDAVNDLEADQQALADQAEEDRQDAILAQMYESDAYDDGYDEEDQFVQDNIMESNLPTEKIGGVPDKRTFVKKVSKVIKAQMGQEVQQPKADPTDTGARQMMMASFLKSVQDSGNTALIKKDAEQIYDMTSTYPYSEGNMPEAQFGANMSKGQQRRFNRRLNRFIGNIPIPIQGIMPAGLVTYPMLQSLQQYIPATGSYHGGPRLANIDVHRVGLFGKPKEYTITFAQEALYNPTLRKQVIKQEARNQNKFTEDEIDEIVNKEEEVTGKTTETAKAEEKKEAEGRRDISGSGASSRQNTSSTRVNSAVQQTPAPWESALQGRNPEWMGQVNFPVNTGYVNPMNAVLKKKSTLPGGVQVVNPFINVPSAQRNINPMDAAMQDFVRQKQERFNIQKQMGGFTDEASGLTRFIYGGDDSFALPTTGGKLVNSPYFAYGGDFQTAGETDSTVVDILDTNGNVVRQATLAEAERAGLRHRISKTQPSAISEQNSTYAPNALLENYTFRQKGLPYFTSTGDPYAGYITPWTDLKSIKVKNRFLRPDQMTINFGNYDPTRPLIGPGSVKTAGQNDEENWTRRQDREAVRNELGRGYKLRQLFQNTMSSKENDQSPNFRNRFNQKRSEKLGVPFPEIKAYGGDVDYAQVGQNYPYAADNRFAPTYTDNPDFVGMSDIDLITPDVTGLTTAPEGIADQSFFAGYTPSVGAPDIKQTTAYKEAQKDPTMNLEIDPNQPNRQTQKKNLEGDFSVKGNLKKKKTNADYIAGLNAFNAGANTLLSMFGERGDKNVERQMRDRLSADALYGSTGAYDRGSYETNSGLLRPNQMGFTGIAKYGGDISYKEGGEAYMSEDQIRKFLEEGGELEFI